MKKLWGGRFKQSTDALMETFSASISFDKRLYDCDIEGSIAHCKMLARCKIITTVESKKIIKGLQRILRECDEGRFEFSESLEDIHMNMSVAEHTDHTAAWPCDVRFYAVLVFLRG